MSTCVKLMQTEQHNISVDLMSLHSLKQLYFNFVKSKTNSHITFVHNVIGFISIPSVITLKFMVI